MGGGIVKTEVHLTGTAVGKKFPETGKYIKEVGDTVVHSSQTVIKNTAHFADGAVTGAYGAVKKDEDKLAEGWDDVKSAASSTAKGMVGGVVFTGKSIGQTVTGVMRQDREQWVDGLKNVGKVTAVMATGVGVLDFAGVLDTDVAEAAELETRNMALDGGSHEVTGVPFATNTVDYENGSYEGVFPVFDSAFDMQLPEDTLHHSDTVHIGIANMSLYEAIQNDPSLAVDLGFDANEVENLKSSVTPEGYDWHHHEEPGRMQLVNEEEHGMTGHTGGRNLWGGGTVAR
ncbi:HNH endonuclease [Sporosarcina cascadiensis]|uniref:HNH endonuclease n=1 Tax=Sporosarcina cascadiensis TaxID=2660747 RepID=UPI00129AA932|nr:HNH endonuclease [Sporosarcina cascadiensis]